MQQYFVNTLLAVNKTISLDEDIVFHLRKVLRNTENNFRLVDSNHDVYIATLLKGNEAKILDKLDEYNELNNDVTALICMIKQDRFEIILQKLTELGVRTIVPVESSYSQSLVFSDNKINRFNKIIKEAAEQSHRNVLPKLLNPIKFNEVVNFKSDLNIVPYEKETSTNKINLKNSSISFIVGPEGGFKSEEIDFLVNNGFKSVSLGKRILRAETAAISIMSSIVWDNE